MDSNTEEKVKAQEETLEAVMRLARGDPRLTNLLLLLVLLCNAGII